LKTLQRAFKEKTNAFTNNTPHLTIILKL